MKKLFVILSLIFLALPAFAEYIPIPANRQAEYKAEIEKYVNYKYKYTIKKINRIYAQANGKYQKVLKNHDTYMDFATSNYESAIFYPILDLFSDMIKITKKYVNIPNGIPATDCTGALYDFLEPYLKNNNINTKTIDNLSKYARNKQKEIEQYYDNTHKLVYPNDNY